MEAVTIEERVRRYYEAWFYSAGGEVIDTLRELATEQDRIARQEERERCIKAAQEWRCNNECPWFMKHGSCPLVCPCDALVNIRETIEKGGNYGND